MIVGRSLKPLKHARLWSALWSLGIAVVVVASLVPAPHLPEVPLGSDKIEHFVGYFLLAAAAVQLYARRASLFGACLALVLLGIGLEFAQDAWTTTRTMDPQDALADTLGVIAGLATVLTPWRDALLRMDPR